MNLSPEISDGADVWELNTWEAMEQLEIARSILLDPVKGHNQSEITQALTIYQQIKRWAELNEFPTHRNDALWGLYLCYNRMGGHPKDAVAALQAVRDNLETVRQKISDPHKRIGILIEYRYLFSALCQNLYQLRRYPELLDAIEGAKGRVVADVISSQVEPANSKESSVPLVEKLLEKVQQVQFHYLTYFVDETETFAVLVSKAGDIHAKSIPFGKNQFDQWLEDSDDDFTPIKPHNWGKVKGKGLAAKLKGNKVINLSVEIGELVSWLEPMVNQGILRPDDHLCYCPDEHLHLIPLHYLPFLGQKLVNIFSISRVHSAALLVELLNHKQHRPIEFRVIRAMAQEDLKQPEMVNGFRGVEQWLSQTMASGSTIADGHANLESLARLSFEQKLIHFATHGIFPDEDLQTNQNQNPNPINPYHSSGLVLATETGELAQNASGAGGALLTPEQVVEHRLNFSQSHITLQACVSGLAKEGIGGDALGLEWAFLLAGASSLLSTHWTVHVESACLFSLSFYQKWLSGQQRSTAWRESVLELMDHPTGLIQQEWAAFSLSGDWR